MSTEESLAALIEESDAFERCSDCGRFVVRLSKHTCSGPTARRNGLTREDRIRLASADHRDGRSRVGVVQRSAGHAYAYHELQGGEPLCGCLGQSTRDEVTVLERSEAKSRGRSPCGNCERILATRLE